MAQPQAEACGYIRETRTIMADPQSLNDDEREQLIAYLDGELAQTDAQSVEKRLHTDPRFRAEADAMRRTWNLLDFLPQPEPSANFTNRTVDRLSALKPAPAGSKDRWRTWLPPVAWVAGLLLAVLVGYAASGRLVPQVNPSSADLPPDAEQRLIRDLRVIEQLGVFQNVDDIHLLNELDRPELFGDDHGS
jgi:anti-sigma factor RsiW